MACGVCACQYVGACGSVPGDYSLVNGVKIGSVAGGGFTDSDCDPGCVGFGEQIRSVAAARGGAAEEEQRGTGVGGG